MIDFSKYGGVTDSSPLPSPSLAPRERSMDTEPFQPGGHQELFPTINYQLAVRDCADFVADFPVSAQPLIASGMYAAITMLAPWLSERFLERLRTTPGCADTASAPDMESIYLMGFPDRGGRDR